MRAVRRCDAGARPGRSRCSGSRLCAIAFIVAASDVLRAHIGDVSITAIGDSEVSLRHSVGVTQTPAANPQDDGSKSRTVKLTPRWRRHERTTRLRQRFTLVPLPLCAERGSLADGAAWATIRQ